MISNDNRLRHLPSLGPLRGLAALAVCIFHFTCGNPEFLNVADPVRIAGAYGWLGVDAFFVISGFIIPYSLFHREPSERTRKKFLIRRLKRLEPPYFACIVLVLMLHLASSVTPGFQGPSLQISLSQLLAHFGYFNALLGFGWINPVFWTLAIEFQFYLFISLTFTLLNHENASTRNVSLIAMVLLGYLGFQNSALLFHWLPLFSIGVIASHYYTNRLSINEFLAILFISCAVSTHVVGVLPTIVGTITAVVILAASHHPVPRIFAPLTFLGTVSYSLYLVHVPVGSRVINLATRLPDSISYRYPAIILAVVLSILFAFGFWWCVERPSQRWAKTSTFWHKPCAQKKPIIDGME